MMAKQNSRTYRSTAAAAHAKVMAARADLGSQTTQTTLEPREEPMRRYPHPIPTACAACVTGGCGCGCGGGNDLTPILEQLQCQSQLLVDILGAVNSLTAAVLCQNQN